MEINRDWNYLGGIHRGGISLGCNLPEWFLMWRKNSRWILAVWNILRTILNKMILCFFNSTIISVHRWYIWQTFSRFGDNVWRYLFLSVTLTANQFYGCNYMIHGINLANVKKRSSENKDEWPHKRSKVTISRQICRPSPNHIPLL